MIRWRTLQNLGLAFSLSVFAFSYGFAANQFRFFPYPLVRQAWVAAESILSITETQETGGLESYRLSPLEPTAIFHCEADADQLVRAPYILLSAGADALKSEYPAGCMAWVIDRRGRVMHVWKNHPELWDKLQKVTQIPGLSGAINPAGMHVFENGDLLATFHGFNTFPFAIGLAKFDRNSRLVWKKELLTHHSFSVAEDGRIFVPAVEVVDSPLALGSTAASIHSPSGKVYRDVILILDRDGNQLQRIDMLEALVNSGWQGQLIRGNNLQVLTDDPLHLNDVRLVGADAQSFPNLDPTDLLVSFRNINTLGILEIDTQRFKWLNSGACIGQHSPRMRQGSVVVLDNLGGDQALGGTQVVQIDLHSGLPSVLFPRAGVPLPDRCRTINSGHLEMHGDGRHALVAITHCGSVWEVDLTTGKVVWEYIYVDPSNGQRGKVGTAKYLSKLSFLRDINIADAIINFPTF